jgi:hypothetical protein
MRHDLRIHACNLRQRANEQLSRHADAEFTAQELVKHQPLLRRELLPGRDDLLSLLILRQHGERLERLFNDLVESWRADIFRIDGQDQ